MIFPKQNCYTPLLQDLLAFDLHNHMLTQNGRLVVFLTMKSATTATAAMSRPRNGRQRHVGARVSTSHNEEVSRSTMDSLVEAETRGESSKWWSKGRPNKQSKYQQIFPDFKIQLERFFESITNYIVLTKNATYLPRL